MKIKLYINNTDSSSESISDISLSTGNKRKTGFLDKFKVHVLISQHSNDHDVTQKR